MPEVKHEKGVNVLLAHSGRRWGQPILAQHCGSQGRGGPALRASGVSESRQWGAADRTTWTPVVGLADETSGRGRLCGVPLVRSSRRQPSTTEGPGGGDRPQGGELDLPGSCESTDGGVNLGDRQL
jgi:hypothetical protein